MNKKIFTSVAVVIVSLSLASCMRSRGFERDQAEFDQASASNYYSGQPGMRGNGQPVEMVGQPKKRIVVFNFWNDTPVNDPTLGSDAADELRKELFDSRKMIVSADAQADLETSNYVQGDRIKVAQLVRAGRKMGVAAVVIGRVGKVVFREVGDDVGIFRKKEAMAAVDLEIKVFDIGSGREVMATGSTGEASAGKLEAFDQTHDPTPEFRQELARLAMKDAAEKLTPKVVQMIEKMSWQGRIARIASGKAYINAGRGSGLIGGDILKVLTPGDDIYDPESGAYLGRADGQLKGTLEVVGFLGDDAAMAVIHTGGNFQEGDLVMLY